MSRSDDERVADILDAADELAAVVRVGHEAFRTSPLHTRAAERLLEIIGEASNSLSEDFKLRHGDVAWRDIAALRILLAHHYHRVDVDQVWQIATDAVPEFVRRLHRP
ncbi:MAG: DUF86 domain-containing protein [Acidimicrobiales bacterium]|nr:DUF86 domain-containing protein [Acidimicrobiales bacterium]